MVHETESRVRFEECVNSCADSMYRVAFRLTGNATLASELVQETYLNAWQGLDSLQETSRMRAWLFSILRFQYTKLVRREKKSEVYGGDLSDIPVRPENRAGESVDRVQLALQQLPEKHRLPLLLVSMEGMSVDETAETLDLPRGTVLSRLHRGRRKLKSILTRDHCPSANQEAKDGS